MAVVKSTVAKEDYRAHRKELSKLLSSFEMQHQRGAPTNAFDMLTTTRTKTASSAELQLLWRPPRNGKLPATFQALSRDVLSGFVDRLNNFFRWRRTMYLEVRECGTANAFYNRRSRTVVFCYNLARAIARAYNYEKKHNVTGLGVRLAKDAFVAWAIEFVLYHEIGHAVISEFDLPIASREEDVADSLAFILMDNHVTGAALRGPQSMVVLDKMGHRRVNYADTHSFSKTRLYDAACFAFGRRPEEYAYWIRSGWCPAGGPAIARMRRIKKRAAWYRFFDGITQPWVAKAEKKTVFGKPAVQPAR